MRRSKANVLKKGNIEYYSIIFGLYFVTERQEYSYRGKACNRLVCFILGKGKHRKEKHRLRKVNRSEYNDELKEVKSYELYVKNKILLEKQRQTNYFFLSAPAVL